MVRISGHEEAWMETKTKINSKILIFSLLAIVLSELFFFALWKMGLMPLPGLLRTLVIRLVQLGLLSAVLYIFGEGISALGLYGRKEWLRGLKRGLIWSAAFGIITGLVFFGLFLFGINPLVFFRSGARPGPVYIFLYILVAVLAGPVIEELFFRGVIYGFFRRWGFFFGLAVSTVIFVALHSRVPGIPYIQIAGGLIFAISYEFEKNILVPVIIHITGNLALYVLSLL